MKKSAYEDLLRATVVEVSRAFDLGPEDTFDTAIVLGTGWGDQFRAQILHSIKLSSLAAFSDLDELEGHERKLELAEVEVVAQDEQGTIKKKIWILRGRVHMNEDTFNQSVRLMVRLQIEVLIKMGVTRLVLTNAAGALIPPPLMRDGDIVSIDKLPSFGPGEVLPLFPGEFKSPESVLDLEWVRHSTSTTFATNTGMRFVAGPYMYYRGPHFENAGDKEEMRKRGAVCVGMSTKPECAVAALYPDVKVIALVFISNDSEEEPDHQLHQDRAHRHAEKLGKALSLAIGF